MNVQTVSFVPFSTIVNSYIPDGYRESFFDYIGQGHSWGDNFYTLVGNKQMLAYLIEFYETEMGKTLSEEKLDEFWQIVGFENFINLED